MQNSSQSHKTFRLPEVQLIGAQKAGTSAIADWLFDGGFCRPKVFENEPWYYSKEVHFFDSEHRYNKGLEFYAKRFQNCNMRNGKFQYLDATPDTLPFPERVRLTYEAAGGNQVHTVKFLVILREPVSRELSLYNHLAHDNRTLCASERNRWHDQVLKEDGSIMSFDEYVYQTSIPALARESGAGMSTRHGMYATNLTKWFQVFDRNQILLLSYHELQNRPEKVQKRIQEFLGFEITGKFKRANALDTPFKIQSPSLEAKRALDFIFNDQNKRLYRLLELNPGPAMEESPIRFPVP